MASAGSIRAGKAFVELFLNKDPLVRGLKSAGADMKKWGASMTSVGTKLMAAGGAMLAPLIASVKAASDMEETMSKFGVVFGDAATGVKAWGDEFAKQVGRSQQQVASFLAGAQDLFVPLGFDPAAAEQMSKTITTLAVDLASFNNMADADAMRDLQAALTGSGEVMKKYGVIVSEAAVKQRLLNDGIDPKAATDQQKVMARLNIILAGTTAAQGDATRTAGSFANQMKRLWANLQDTAALVGQALLPTLSELATRINSIGPQVAEWVQNNQELIMTAAKAAVALIGVGGALVGLGAAFNLAGAGMIALTNPMTLMLVAAGAAAVAIYKLTAASEKLSDTLRDARKEADEQQTADQAKLKRLEELANKQKLSTDEMTEARKISRELRSAYGDLGIELDNVANKLDVAADAQSRLNQIQDAGKLDKLRKEYAALEEEMQAVEAGPSGVRAAASAAGAYLYEQTGIDPSRDAERQRFRDERARVGGRLDEVDAEITAIAARMAARSRGAPEAEITGGPEAAGLGPAGVDDSALDRRAEIERRAIERVAELRVRAIQDATQREIELVRLRYAKEIEEAQKAGASTTAIYQAQQAEIAQIGQQAWEAKGEEQKRKSQELADLEKSLAEDVERAKIEATMTGREKELALLDLARRQELDRVKEQGGGEKQLGLVNQRFDLMAQGIDAESVAATSSRGTFSAAGAGLLGAGGGIQEKQLAGIEGIEKNTTGLIDAIKQLIIKWTA